jgi:hypothetical protein
MSGMDQFMNFMKNGDKDRRLTPIHISLYTALFYYWRLNDYASSFRISRKAVMSLALIKSTATYHKCVSEMAAFGYIEYIPTYHPLMGSKVRLIFDREI